MASVLAVVAGSPAQAANTSSEALEDTNGDGVRDAREFGGRDRYDTANRLAANFGEREGLGNVPVAFVASGYMLVDAISVAGLAGFLDAPVLLTPMDSLNGGVADFIEDYGVQTVHVLGGASAVSDTVVEAIEALANKPTVTRIYGDDRYATAAAVASRLGGGASWCGGAEAAAILANGGDVSLAYAMAISPVANRLQLPLLLTAQGELPMATEDFITSQDIEHVVIMGGESSVSDDVSAALTDAGVDTVTRIDGDTPAEASAMLAELATNGCQVDLGLVENDTVALVAESGLPDGVAASPVLASSYQNGNLVPMLVVGDELPAAVSDYLAATSNLSGTNKLHLEIVAIGGTAAVSDEVMQAALAAAASADALTAQISSGGLEGSTTRNGDTNSDGKIDADDMPAVGDDTIILRFSDNIVDNTTANNNALTSLVRDNLEINGAPARLTAANGVTAVARGQASTGTAICVPDTVTVILASPLKAGDVISLAGGARFGDNMDRRTVAATAVTVPAAARDTSAPVVNVIAIDAGAEANNVVQVRFDPLGLDAVGNDGLNDTIDTNEIVITSADPTTPKPPAADQNRATGTTIAVNTVVDGVASGTPTTLAAGDRITIKSGALVDMAGNKSRARTFTVLAAQASPSVTAVTMSNPVHPTQARAVVPLTISGATQNDPATPATFDGISITAKKGGAADGAVGNGWTFAFDRATAWKNDPKAAIDIDVRVSSKDRLVSVRFNTGNAKFADLKAALEANSAFDELFMVNLPARAGVCGATANNPLQIGAPSGGTAFDRGVTAMTDGGSTAIAIEVRFNAYVRTVDVDELADAVFAQVINRYNANPANATDLTSATGGTPDIPNVTTATRIAHSLVTAADGTVSDVALTDVPNAADPVLLAPATSVRYEMVTDRADLLPKLRDLVDVEAGIAAASAISGTPAFPAIDAVAAVALGYAADVRPAGVTADDDARDTVDEDKNGASQRRIGQSSTVKAPDFE